MTLAPSPRPLLSGSSILLPALMMIFFSASSCNLFRKAPDTDPQGKDSEYLDEIKGRRVWDPELGQYVIIKDAPDIQMDTIQWTFVDEEVSPPIVSSNTGRDDEAYLLSLGEKGTQFFSSYNVSLMLPFLTDRFHEEDVEINENSHWALHYYAGTKLALRDLEKEGVNLKVSVHDSKASESVVQRLLGYDKLIRNAHLLMGPYRRDNIRQVAEYAKLNDKTYVSPYSGTANLSRQNPNYIQVSPTLKTHCEALGRQVLSQYEPDQVMLVCQDNPAERSWLQYFQVENMRQAGTSEVDPLLEYHVPATSTDFAELTIDSNFLLQDTVVFIVPSWTEPFVYSFLRNLDLQRYEEQYIEVYGLPQWMTFENMDFDYYEALNVHVSSNYFIDHEAIGVQLFKDRFFDTYGIPPRMEAYLGYDVMLFTGRMLEKHGTKFQYFLEDEKAKYLHTRFEFEPLYQPGQEEVQPAIEQFENNFVHILRFQDYRFLPVSERY